ncbi:MAG: regulatory protein RecX [Gemmatimonadota bacterium]|jgi:regulatory protein|nr:hypothetical protein [Gemmatimonadota bacterium]MDP6529409.1 regulatory protein RecX [Gemmatimonadota bacterium]MDP6802710.1 regulatory protein RecX [Gemmatimonadota bacterium]MDP7032518.1 regulatory protein RecX [Gemmatimonadota bacterium]
MAIRYLGSRMRFESEVRSHLNRKGVPGEAQEAALERLRELGLLSDRDTCAAWIRDRMNFSPRGTIHMRRDLLRRGVDRQVVEDALSAELAPGAETDLAVRVLKGRAKRFVAVSKDVARRRMWSVLAGRGFPPEVVHEAIDRFAVDRESPLERAGEL